MNHSIENFIENEQICDLFLKRNKKNFLVGRVQNIIVVSKKEILKE